MSYNKPLVPNQVKEVARHCREYAERYNCTLNDALADYEFEDENGPSGLFPHEKAQVAAELRGQGFHLDVALGEGDDSANHDDLKDVYGPAMRAGAES